jgi:hypothetical protein
MADELKASFTPEKIAEQAQGNATALILVTIAYLRDQELAVDEYMAFAGRQLAPGWEDLQGQATKDIAEWVALNMVSMGGTLQSLSGGDSQAEVVIVGWPSEDLRTLLELDRADADPVWNIFQPIAEYLGLKFAWKRQEDEVTLSFSRQSSE